jgi:hypothetical protein
MAHASLFRRHLVARLPDARPRVRLEDEVSPKPLLHFAFVRAISPLVVGGGLRPRQLT